MRLLAIATSVQAQSTEKSQVPMDPLSLLPRLHPLHPRHNLSTSSNSHRASCNPAKVPSFLEATSSNPTLVPSLLPAVQRPKVSHSHLLRMEELGSPQMVEGKWARAAKRGREGWA